MFCANSHTYIRKDNCVLKTTRIMPLVTVQNSELSHNVHSTNNFSNIYGDTVWKKKNTEYSLIVFTKDNKFLVYLCFQCALKAVSLMGHQTSN